MKWFALGIGYVVSTIYSGWVLTVLWGWFIVSTFGLPALSIPLAIGLNLLVVLLTINAQPYTDKEKGFFESVSGAMVFGATVRTLFLISGWTLHQFFV